MKYYFASLFLALCAAGCAAGNFHNNDIVSVSRSFADLLQWRWEAWRHDLPTRPQGPTPVMAPDLHALQGHAKSPQAQPQATWIGHATVLVQHSGLSVLTDPVFSDRASPISFIGPKRAQAPGVAMQDLPAIDLVLISHNHYDHLDLASVQALAARSQGSTLFLVPLGLKAWFEAQGIDNVIELGWWQSHVHRGVEFVLTPVQHWSARTAHDRNATLWGGWAIFGPDFHWYFSGDTGYSQDFTRTRQQFVSRWAQPDDGFDLALIAIGAYEPRWFMAQQHVNPAEAVQIHRDLGARRSMGVHWGTFELSDEALDQPPRDLALARSAAGLLDVDFFVLKIGETRTFPPRQLR